MTEEGPRGEQGVSVEVEGPVRRVHIWGSRGSAIFQFTLLAAFFWLSAALLIANGAGSVPLLLGVNIPVTLVLTYLIAVAWVNRTTITLTPSSTTICYGPLPVLRRQRELGPVLRARWSREVDYKRASRRHGRPIGSIGPTRTVYAVFCETLFLADASLRYVPIRLEPPGYRSMRQPQDREEVLLWALGLFDEDAKERQAQALAARRQELGTPGGRGICPRDGSRLEKPASDDAAWRCPRCKGAFATAYRVHEAVKAKLDVDEPTLRALAAHFGGEHTSCPGCARSMEAAQLRGVPVELCFSCGGAWLDEGEDQALLGEPLP